MHYIDWFLLFSSLILSKLSTNFGIEEASRFTLVEVSSIVAKDAKYWQRAEF